MKVARVTVRAMAHGLAWGRQGAAGALTVPGPAGQYLLWLWPCGVWIPWVRYRFRMFSDAGVDDTLS